MTVFFGERWDAPIVDDATQVPTPEGEHCYDCAEPIVAGDRGLVRAGITGEGIPETLYIHAECDVRGVVGHTVGLCRCTGYPSNRATARLVWQHCFGGRS